ncbi:MAG: HAD family hydrolase [Nanoarchaeota archaeon]
MDTRKIKVISFDMDGCLSDDEFDNTFYFIELPSIIAKKKGISFKETSDFARNSYDSMRGEKQWTDPTYWIKRFEIEGSLQDIVKNIRKQLVHFRDAVPVLKSLKKDYRLIVVSAATSHFLDLKLAEENIAQYFEAVYSMSDDFGTMKKEPEIYKEICKKLGITTDEIVHVGDSRTHDYDNPTKAGIKSFLLDRKAVEKHDFVVNTLYEFEEKARALG